MHLALYRRWHGAGQNSGDCVLQPSESIPTGPKYPYGRMQCFQIRNYYDDLGKYPP